MRRRDFGNPFANAARVLLSKRPWRAVRELVRVRVDRSDSSAGGWCVRVDLGRGAGYRVGRTAFLGRRVRDWRGYHLPRRGVDLGFTRNARRVPLV